MTNRFIGRIRMNDRARAYRLPIRLPSEPVVRHMPDVDADMYDVRKSRTARTRELRDRLNSIAHAIKQHDIDFIRAKARTHYLKITLQDDERYLDYGNRFERIERILTDALDAEVRDIPRHRRFRW